MSSIFEQVNEHTHNMHVLVYAICMVYYIFIYICMLLYDINDLYYVNASYFDFGSVLNETEQKQI